MKKAKNFAKCAEEELKIVLGAAAQTRGLSALIRKKPWQVSLRLTTRAQMKKANSQYRGKNYATDVLSFPAPEVFWHAGVLGDLLICEPVLKSQAREQQHDTLTELRVLLVHGVLHLLEFDHERSAKAAREMARFEKVLLKKLDSAKGLIERTHSGTKDE